MRQIVLESSESANSSPGATNSDSEASGVVRTAKSIKTRLYTKPKRPPRRLPRPRSGDFTMGSFTLYNVSDGRPLAQYRTSPPPDAAQPSPLQPPPDPPPLQMSNAASMVSSPTPQTPQTPLDDRDHEEVVSGNIIELLPPHEVPPPPNWGLYLSSTRESSRELPATRKAMDISFLLNED